MRAARTLRSTAVSWFVLLWSACILVAYVIARDEDLQPVLGAIGGRVLDVAVPFLFLLAYWPLSRKVLRALSVRTVMSGSDLLIEAAIALAFQMLIATACGACGVLSAWVIVTAAGLALLLGARECVSIGRDLQRAVRDLLRTPFTLPGALCTTILAAALLMALLPPVSQDALHYHLAVPKLWLDSGAFSVIPGNVYSHFPMNTEMLFVSTLAVRGACTAQVCHWLLTLLAALAVRRLAGNFATCAAASWGALLFLAVPTVFRVASWANVEAAGVFYVVMAWECALALTAAGAIAPRGAALIGFLVGIAAGTKYTLLLPAIVMAAYCIARGSGTWLRSAAAFSAAASIAGGFWYLRNLLLLGNPVFPFLFGVFGGAGWDAERARLYDEFLGAWGSGGWLLPFTVTFDATFFSITRFDGIVGPVFLLGLPLVILAAWRWPGARWTAALALLLVVSWCTTTRQVRFLLPALAFFAALIPGGWEALPGSRLRAWVHRTVAAAALLSLAPHMLLFVRDAPLAYAVGSESAEAVCARNFPGGDYALFRDIEKVVPSGGSVLFAGSGNPIFYCERSFHADSVVENHTLRRMLKGTPAPAVVAHRFAAAGFTHLVFRTSLVFGPSSDLPAAERDCLAAVLAQYGKLELRCNETVLYCIEAPR